MRTMKRLLLLGSTSLLAACATVPNGPSVMVMPGSGKSFEQFQLDDQACRDYAQNRLGGATARDNAVSSGFGSAALGTVVGAAAGALIGGNHQGAAVGAGAGLLAGTLAGSDAAGSSGRITQRQYDQSYIQCMYAKGERVPLSGYPSTRERSPSRHYAPPPPPDDLD